MASCCRSCGGFRLSYPRTDSFSAKQTLVGIIALSIIYTAVGIVYGGWKGEIYKCVPENSNTFINNGSSSSIFASTFSLGRFSNEANMSCQPSTILIGEMLYQPQLTYIVASQFNNYGGEMLDCSIKQRGLTINLISVRAPQFVWDYKISCTQLVATCHAGGRNTCLAFDLTIQAFSTVSSKLNTTAVVDLRTNLTNMLGGDKADNCSGEDITVLRFAENSLNKTKIDNKAFTRSSECPSPLASNVSKVLNNSKDLVEAAMFQDLGMGFRNFSLPRTYLCQVCTFKHDSAWKIALDVATGLTSLGTFCYTAVMWIMSRMAKDALSHKRLEPEVELN